MTVRIKELTVEYRADDHRLLALDRVDLELQPGKVTALVGESGSGKTTLAKAILGLSPENASVRGSIHLGEQEIIGLDEAAINELRWSRVAMVFQNGADTLNPVYRLSAQVAEPLIQRLGRDPEQAREEARRTMMAMGLAEELTDRFPHELSGGQVQRALLAMALIMDPEILVLDEPTASLDAMTTNFIHTVIRDLAENNKTILLITHDLDLVNHTADEAAVLYLGQIMEYLPARAMFHPCHPYTLALARSFPGMDAVRDLGGIRGDGFYRLLHTHSSTKDAAHTHTVSKRHSHEDGHSLGEGCLFQPRCTQADDTCRFGDISLVENGEHRARCLRGGIVKLLQLENVSKSYNETCALHPVSLELWAGEVFCLVGETGSGKSTLAMIAAASLEPDSGQRVFEGLNMGELIRRNYRQLASRIGVINQNPGKAVSHRLNVFDIVAEPLVIQKNGWTKQEISDRVLQALDDVHLSVQPEFLERYPHELNMGAIQRLCLARALVHGPDLLIADEPTSALDPSVQAKVLKMLMNLQIEKGLTMLFITHDIGLARKISDRIGVMLSGRIVEVGPASTIFSRPAHPYTKMLIDSARGSIECDTDIMDREKIGVSVCAFSSRCFRMLPQCRSVFPAATNLLRNYHQLWCHNPVMPVREEPLSPTMTENSIPGGAGLRN